MPNAGSNINKLLETLLAKPSIFPVKSKFNTSLIGKLNKEGIKINVTAIFTLEQTRRILKHIGKKTKWVYPLHNLSLEEEKGWNNEEIILVESIGDFLSVYENTSFKCLVTFGLDVSPALVNALVALSPKLIIISTNNDQESKENRGLNAAIKNYLKLLEFFDPDKIRICLPTENDFGDMAKKDYNTWEAKLKNIKSKKQSQYILEEANNLYKKKKISKSLFSSTKFINE